MVSTNPGEIVERIPLIEALLNARHYAFYFKNDTSLKRVQRDFSGGGYNIVRLYYIYLDGYRDIGREFSWKDRRCRNTGVNRAVRDLKIGASYVFAAAQYESGCTHIREDIESGKIKECECYGIICEILGDVDFVWKRPKSKVELIS